MAASVSREISLYLVRFFFFFDLQANVRVIVEHHRMWTMNSKLLRFNFLKKAKFKGKSKFTVNNKGLRTKVFPNFHLEDLALAGDKSQQIVNTPKKTLNLDMKSKNLPSRNNKKLYYHLEKEDRKLLFFLIFPSQQKYILTHNS